VWDRPEQRIATEQLCASSYRLHYSGIGFQDVRRMDFKGPTFTQPIDKISATYADYSFTTLNVEQLAHDYPPASDV
jgi:hypothetical protein